MTGHDRLTREEANRLWERAAEIQAEASRRAEATSAREAADELGGTELASAEDGYALTHVRAAAAEAGIGAEFIDAALADLRVERALGGPMRARWTRWFVGSPPDALRVSRVINAPVDAVLSAMERVTPSAPFSLVLRDRQGDPRKGGVLTFDMLGAGTAGEPQSGFARQARLSDLREIHASVIPLGEGSCELTLRAPIGHSFGMTALLGAAITAGGGAAGMGIGSALAAMLAATASTFGLATLAPVLAGAAVASGIGGGAGGAHTVFRKIHRHALERATSGIASLAGAIAVEAEGGWRPPQAQLSPEASGRD